MAKSKKGAIKVKGLFRLNVINPNGKVIGDSGWRHNSITDNGFQQFLMYLLAGSAGSIRPGYAALGTGTAASTNSTLVGQLTETGCKVALTTGISGSKIVVYTFTVASGTLAAASTIQNVGLYYYTAQSQANANGTMMACTTYATSSLATNQAVNGTYQIIFG